MSDQALDEIVLTVRGDPVPWAQKQTNPKTGGKFVAARQAKYAGLVIDAWERSAAAGVFLAKGKPVRLVAEFYLARPKAHYGSGGNARQLKDSAPMLPTGRPDRSNLLKMVEDALTSHAWADDDQIVDGSASKRLVDWWQPAYAVIRITPLPYESVKDFQVWKAQREAARA